MSYVLLKEREGVAVTHGFIVVRIQATRTARQVGADGFVDNELVASASAADNLLDGVISSNRQTFTMPVQAGDKWRVEFDGNGESEVRWVAL